jgi:transposase InsO family protein
MERKVKYDYAFKLECVELVLKKHYSCESVSKEKGIIQSMSRKGNCLDNAIIENFFGILKSELFYIKKFRTIEELKAEIKQYIYYYNNVRIKSNLNKMSPIKYRAHYYQN